MQEQLKYHWVISSCSSLNSFELRSISEQEQKSEKNPKLVADAEIQYGTMLMGEMVSFISLRLDLQGFPRKENTL